MTNKNKWILIAVTLFIYYKCTQAPEADTTPIKIYTKSKEEKEADSIALAQITAQNNIKRFVKSQLNDPDSYEPVDFGNVIDYPSRTEPYIISHSWRAKNGYNAFVLEEYNFFLRKDMSVIRAKIYPR